MIVILDTNIIRQDILLRSPKIDLLLDLLSRTRSRLVLPAVVYEEVRGLYLRDIQRHHNQLEKARRTLQELMFDREIAPTDLDVHEQVERYLSHLRGRLKLNDADIVPYKNEYLPDVVSRATNRLHPFTDNRKEFRDVVLWLTSLDICTAERGETVALVSSNTKDFADKEGEALHPALAKEMEGKGVNIQYYSSLDHFLKSHATKFDFITEEWILDHIDSDQLRKELEQELKRWDESAFQDCLKRCDDDEFHAPTLTGLPNFDLTDYYCLGMSDGSVRIEAFFGSECEVEYISYREEEEEYSDYDWDFDPIKGDWDWRYVTRTRVVPVEETRYAYLWVESQIDIVVRDQEVEQVELTRWHLQ